MKQSKKRTNKQFITLLEAVSIIVMLVFTFGYANKF